MPGGDEEEARVEEGVKNGEEKHVRDFGDKPEVITAEKGFFLEPFKWQGKKTYGMNETKRSQ